MAFQVRPQAHLRNYSIILQYSYLLYMQRGRVIRDVKTT